MEERRVRVGLETESLFKARAVNEADAERGGVSCCVEGL
jgi:hypothetical protein